MKTKRHNTIPFSVKVLAMFLIGIMVFALASTASASGILAIPILSNINAKYVGGIMAAKLPTANKLLPLNASKKFPVSVITQGPGSGLNADVLDGFDSSVFAKFGSVLTGAGAQGLKVTNTQGGAPGVWGTTDSSTANSSGVFGQANATSGATMGVWGMSSSPNGVGVFATGASAGSIALEIQQGGIKVAGAGIDTDTPAFVHKATVANIVFGYATIINNSLTNNDPNAILIVTPNYNPGNVVAGYNNHPIGVMYNDTTGEWLIFNQDIGAMPVGAAFNVLVIKP
jgi:hypothetical protein